MGTVIAHVERVDRRTLQQIEQVGIDRVGLGQNPDESKPEKPVRREVHEQTPSNQRATAPPCIPPGQPLFDVNFLTIMMFRSVCSKKVLTSKHDYWIVRLIFHSFSPVPFGICFSTESRVALTLGGLTFRR